MIEISWSYRGKKLEIMILAVSSLVEASQLCAIFIKIDLFRLFVGVYLTIRKVCAIKFKTWPVEHGNTSRFISGSCTDSQTLCFWGIRGQKWPVWFWVRETHRKSRPERIYVRFRVNWGDKKLSQLGNFSNPLTGTCVNLWLGRIMLFYASFIDKSRST